MKTDTKAKKKKSQPLKAIKLRKVVKKNQRSEMEDGEQERVARSNYKNQKQTFFF